MNTVPYDLKYIGYAVVVSSYPFDNFLRGRIFGILEILNNVVIIEDDGCQHYYMHPGAVVQFSSIESARAFIPKIKRLQCMI